MRQKEALKNTIDRQGKEAFQELADQMLEEGNLSEKTYEMISWQVQLHQK